MFSTTIGSWWQPTRCWHPIYLTSCVCVCFFVLEFPRPRLEIFRLMPSVMLGWNATCIQAWLNTSTFGCQRFIDPRGSMGAFRPSPLVVFFSKKSCRNHQFWGVKTCWQKNSEAIQVQWGDAQTQKVWNHKGKRHWAARSCRRLFLLACWDQFNYRFIGGIFFSG